MNLYVFFYQALCLPVLDFRFEPVMYAVLSTLETLPLTISLFSGNFSDFGVILGARTDDNSSNSTAIGKQVCK